MSNGLSSLFALRLAGARRVCGALCVFRHNYELVDKLVGLLEHPNFCPFAVVISLIHSFPFVRALFLHLWILVESVHSFVHTYLIYHKLSISVLTAVVSFEEPLTKHKTHTSHAHYAKSLTQVQNNNTCHVRGVFSPCGNPRQRSKHRFSRCTHQCVRLRTDTRHATRSGNYSTILICSTGKIYNS